jgi:hypothetical protein
VSADTPASERGLTPAELARILRVSPDRVRGWIQAGELGAIDTARQRCRKPRYVVLPVHLDEFLRRRRAATLPPKTRRRKKTSGFVDYFPD